jgi:hypothetical protein
MPTSLARHDMGLPTVIGRNNKDAAGQTLDAPMRSRMGRLRTWDFRAQDSGSGDRNLRQAFSELYRLKGKLGLSDAIVEKKAYIYRKAHRRGLVRVGLPPGYCPPQYTLHAESWKLQRHSRILLPSQISHREIRPEIADSSYLNLT